MLQSAHYHLQTLTLQGHTLAAETEIVAATANHTPLQDWPWRSDIESPVTAPLEVENKACITIPDMTNPEDIRI